MTVANTISPSISVSRMTEQEYLDWVVDRSHTEWVAGEVVFKMPISKLHDLLQAAIRSSVEALVRRRSLGQVRGENWAMRLPDRPSWREADLIFVSAQNPAELTDTELRGAADLAVEVVSPDSVARDYRVKYAEYEAACVREYWIVDPLSKTVEAHRLGDDRKYAAIAPDAEGKIHSTVITGWWLQASLLFKEPTPDALELIQALGVV